MNVAVSMKLRFQMLGGLAALHGHDGDKHKQAQDNVTSRLNSKMIGRILWYIHRFSSLAALSELLQKERCEIKL